MRTSRVSDSHSMRSPNRPRRWASLPHSGAGDAPGGGGGANGAIVRNSAPSMPSGVQDSSPSVPPTSHTRTSSPAASAWWGANITPIADITTSKDSSANGSASASASTQFEVERRAPAAGLQQLGREVGGGHVGAARAAGIEALPVPAATSSTRVPYPIAHASTRRGPSGVRKVSTIAGIVARRPHRPVLRLEFRGDGMHAVTVSAGPSRHIGNGSLSWARGSRAQRRADPRASRRHVGRIDVVGGVGLVVLDVHARFGRAARWRAARSPPP